MNRRYQFVVTAALLLGGCAPKVARHIPAPEPPPAPALVLPPYSTVAELAPVPLPTELPPMPIVVVDAVSVAVAEAWVHFDRGMGLYDAGFLKQARSEFDTAVDLLLDSSRVHPGSNRIAREVTDLVARVHEMELMAIRNGDGFADQEEQHAAIDDLGQLTFPAPIDPKLKQTVEEGIRSAEHDLPIEITDRVLAALSYYQNGRGRNTMAVGLERAGVYRPMMERILKEEGVPLDLVFLSQAESAFLPRALSRAKARGLWQFISSRGKEYGLRQTWWIDERSDPEKSTRAAARHLRDLHEQFNDWYLAMAAYNACPARVEKALKKTGSTTFWQLADKKALPKETINYVPTILALTIIGKNPEQYGFSVQPAAPMETERVGLEQATDLRVIAETLEIPVDRLKELNPHVLRWTTPPGDAEFELVLPAGHTTRFTELVASLPPSERVLWRHHDVKKGETLSVIARKYGVAVNDLTQANNLNIKKTLNVGQELLIPMSGNGPKVVAVAAVTPETTPSSYTVRRGDTLSAIATRFKVTVNDLKTWNKLKTTRLDVGQKLVLAGSAVRQAN